MEINQIYNEDVLEFLKALKDESIDLFIADFPYNISNYDGALTKVGNDYVKADFGEWDKFKSIDDYAKWVVEIAKEMNRILKDSCQAYMFFDNHFAGHYTYLIEKHTELQQKCPIVLYKKNPIFQLRKRNFRSSFDMCVLFVKNPDKKCKTFNFLQQSEMKNVQAFALNKKTKHPTEKNLNIIRKFIKISSNKGEIVCDPFVGSGTTALASLMEGRLFIANDNNLEYVQMARKRLLKIPNTKIDDFFTGAKNLTPSPLRSSGNLIHVNEFRSESSLRNSSSLHPNSKSKILNCH